MGNKIKLGDKVTLSKDAPSMFFYGADESFIGENGVVSCIEDGNAFIKYGNGTSGCMLAIPCKYLVKVDDEVKDEKFKFGDKVKIVGGNPDFIGKVVEIEAVGSDGSVVVYLYNVGHSIYKKENIEHYTEPTEQTEAEKKPDVGSIKIPVEVDLSEVAKEYAEAMSNAIREYGDALCKHGTFIRMVDDLYKRNLAKEVALKVANKFNDPKEAAEYAVQVSEQVVKKLKK